MGQATVVYCDKCGAMIAGADFDRGKAVERAGKKYCPECALTLPAEPADKPPSRIHHPHRTSGETSKIRRPSDTDVLRSLQGLGGKPHGHGHTTRHIAHEAPSETAGLSTSAKIGIAAGALVAIILVAVIVSSQSSSPSPGSSPNNDAQAQEAFKKVESLRSTASPKDWLEAVNRARRENAGSSMSDEFDALHKEAVAAVDAAEKAAKIERDLNRLAFDAASAENPGLFIPHLMDLRRTASTDAPALVEKIDAEMAKMSRAVVLKQLGRIDIGLSVTPLGYKRVKEELEAVAAEAAKAGAAGKTALEQIAGKQKEALAMFEKKSEEALKDLEGRVEKMIAEGRFDEATRALKMFDVDYEGTPVSGKTAGASTKLEKARKEYEASWVSLAEDKDWQKELGKAKATFAAGVITLLSEEAAGVADTSRRMGFALKDKAWRNFELHFDVNLEKVGGCLQLRTAGEPHNLNLVVAANGQPGLAPNRWTRITLKIVDTKISIGGEVDRQEFDTKDGTGGFAFAVFAGGKFQLRNVRIRKLK